MLEEHRVADSGMGSVGDVDLVTPIMIPCVPDVDTAHCGVPTTRELMGQDELRL